MFIIRVFLVPAVLMGSTAANVIFELHQSPGGDWFVRFTYDFDPSITSPTQTQYVALPRNGAIVDWDKV